MNFEELFASKKSLLKSIALTLFLFVTIYQPPFVRISTSTILMLMMFMYFCWNSMSQGTIRINTKSINILTGFVPFVVYVIINTFIKIGFGDRANRDAYMENLSKVTNPAIFTIISVLFILTLTKNGDKANTELVMNALIGVVILQLIFNVCGYFVPSVQEIFNDFVKNNSKNEQTIKNVLKYGYRTYGLSGYFCDYIGMLTAFLSTLVFLKGISQKKYLYVFISFATLIIPMFNARTGLILSVVGFCCVLMIYTPKVEGKTRVQWIGVFFLGICVLIVVFFFMPKSMQEWVLSSFLDTNDLINSDEKSGVYGQILNKDWVLPKNDELFFGIGGKPEHFNVFAADHSDIDSGYVQCIWRFGLVGTGLLFFGYLHTFGKLIFHTKSTYKRTVGVFFSVFVLLYYFKGLPLALHGFNFLILCIPIVLYNTRSKFDEFGTV